MIFETKVNGIPCQCKVTHYLPAIPATVNGPPEDCHEGDSEEFEFELLDRRGRPAAWLDRYITPEVEAQLAEDHHDLLRADYYEGFDA